MTTLDRQPLRLRPIAALRGELAVPGDKSISHRALICNALARGEARVTNLLESADCLSTMACLERWGVQFEREQGATIVRSPGLDRFHAPAGTLDCGNSGTTMRLLAGIAATLPFRSTLDGDDSLRRRPMDRVLEPLAQMGAATDGADGGRLAPIVVGGQPEGLRPFRGRLSVASGQLKSALIFAALRATAESNIEEVGPSRDHTERMLGAMGARINTDGAMVRVQPGAALRPRDVDVPGDISAAAFWMVAAAIVPNSDLTLPAVGINPTRAGIIDALRAMGADLTLEHEREVSGEPVADLRVRHAPLRGFEAAGDLVVRALDEWPVIAVAAALADGPTTIRDAEELRVKESDRIAATAAMLRALGAEVEERPDGLRIAGGATLRGGVVESRGDHRIAMAAAVAAMIAEGETELRGGESVAISYPEFWRDLERLRDAAAA